jgi:hypothetical protein
MKRFKLIHPFSIFWIETEDLTCAILKGELFATLMGSTITLVDEFGEKHFCYSDSEKVIMSHD